jgi:hypothetical protein
MTKMKMPWKIFGFTKYFTDKTFVLSLDNFKYFAKSSLFMKFIFLLFKNFIRI